MATLPRDKLLLLVSMRYTYSLIRHKLVPMPLHHRGNIVISSQKIWLLRSHAPLHQASCQRQTLFSLYLLDSKVLLLARQAASYRWAVLTAIC